MANIAKVTKITEATNLSLAAGIRKSGKLSIYSESLLIPYSRSFSSNTSMAITAPKISTERYELIKTLAKNPTYIPKIILVNRSVFSKYFS